MMKISNHTGFIIYSFKGIVSLLGDYAYFLARLTPPSCWSVEYEATRVAAATAVGVGCVIRVISVKHLQLMLFQKHAAPE